VDQSQPFLMADHPRQQPTSPTKSLRFRHAEHAEGYPFSGGRPEVAQTGCDFAFWNPSETSNLIASGASWGQFPPADGRKVLRF
jgi:hypothetical protein